MANTTILNLVKPDYTDDADIEDINANSDKIDAFAGNTIANIGGTDFSTSSTYAVGQIVKYNGKLYKCVTAVTTAGAWSASNWEEVSLQDEIDDTNEFFSTYNDNGVSMILNSGDLNTIKTPGRYYATSNVANIPFSGASGYLDVYAYDSNRVAQTFRQFNDDKVYERRLISGTWGSWTSLSDQMVKIKTQAFSMESSADNIRLETWGVSRNKFIAAFVTSANNISCIPYAYSSYGYIRFVNSTTMALASGTYSGFIIYYE